MFWFIPPESQDRLKFACTGNDGHSYQSARCAIIAAPACFKYNNYEYNSDKAKQTQGSGPPIMAL